MDDLFSQILCKCDVHVHNLFYLFLTDYEKVYASFMQERLILDAWVSHESTTPNAITYI